MLGVDKNLKESHPQKYFLKMMCRFIYIMGMGDCWYEKIKKSNTHKTVYAVWAAFINGYLILNTFNELLANFRSDLTTKEKNDLIQFSLAHPSLIAKYLFLILQKDQISVLFKRMMEESSVTFRSLSIEKKSVKKSIRYFVGLCAVTYGTLFLTSIDAYTALKKEGVLFQTEVTLLPSRSATGYFANFLRVMIEAHWWALVTNMVLVDGLSFTSMVYLGYKFRLVSMHFRGLRNKILENLKTKTETEAAEEYKKDFVMGIRLHEDTLWCARNVQNALGNIYGVQIIESISLLVICLIKLVRLERNMTFLLANSFYIACLLTLNGAYMMAAGDVTYEASLLPMSMFQSGWELVRTGKQFRALMVVAIQRSQVPVYLTAFGVITLSHRNFISVIRSSYSFFAVMY